MLDHFATPDQIETVVIERQTFVGIDNDAFVEGFLDIDRGDRIADVFEPARLVAGTSPDIKRRL